MWNNAPRVNFGLIPWLTVTSVWKNRPLNTDTEIRDVAVATGCVVKTCLYGTRHQLLCSALANMQVILLRTDRFEDAMKAQQ